MSSGYSGDLSNFLSTAAANMNRNLSRLQFPHRPPLAGIPLDPDPQIRQPDKRPFQPQQGFGLGSGSHLRNVKPRSGGANYQFHPSPVDFPTIPSNYSFSVQNPVDQSKIIMNQSLKELEKQLLGDDDDDDVDCNGSDVFSVVTNSEWSPHSHEISNLLVTDNNPATATATTNKPPPVSPSPTSSSSSSSCSSTPPPCPKQSAIDAAAAISDGNFKLAAETLTRLRNLGNSRGTPEQRLVAYVVSALDLRVGGTGRGAVEALYGEEHGVATQLLYDVSPCFKLGFMAANLGIIEAALEQGLGKIHVVDFEIGRGRQYVHLLHSLAASAKSGTGNGVVALKITTFAGSTSGNEEEVKGVGAALKALAVKLGVSFSFNVKSLNITDLSRESLQSLPDEALVFNFAFKLYKLPDESVTTENQRDELLRRVKSLSPTIVTVVEQEMNTNTAPLAARVREACDHYGALFDSLDATVGRDNSDRLKIEEGLGRRLGNAIACEGKDRVERCEVSGKWRARMGMAGFEQRRVSQVAAELLRSKLEAGTRGDSGFTVEERFGGVCFGWKGRAVTVASTWR